MEEIKAMAQDALTLLLVASGLLLAVGFAVNFLGQQVLVLTGNSFGLSRIWVRLIGMIAGFLLVLFAPTITGWVITALAGTGL